MWLACEENVKIVPKPPTSLQRSCEAKQNHDCEAQGTREQTTALPLKSSSPPMSGVLNPAQQNPKNYSDRTRKKLYLLPVVVVLRVSYIRANRQQSQAATRIIM